MKLLNYIAVQLAKGGAVIAVAAILAFMSQSVAPSDFAPFAGALRACVYVGAYLLIPRAIERRHGRQLSLVELKSMRKWIVGAAVVLEAVNLFLMVKAYGS